MGFGVRDSDVQKIQDVLKKESRLTSYKIARVVKMWEATVKKVLKGLASVRWF